MDSRAEVLRAGPREHVVLFYSDDAELIRNIGDYLLSALREGGAAIMLGTWAHSLSVGRYLARAGFDLPAARARGTYAELDAASILGKCVFGDHADAAGFWSEITPAIRAAAGAGTRVRIFGETVSLLWQDGRAAAAIEIEAMWNELGAQFPFSLLCGYPIAAFAGDGQLDALTEICRAHSAVTGDPPPAMRGWRY